MPGSGSKLPICKVAQLSDWFWIRWWSGFGEEVVITTVDLVRTLLTCSVTCNQCSGHLSDIFWYDVSAVQPKQRRVQDGSKSHP